MVRLFFCPLHDAWEGQEAGTKKGRAHGAALMVRGIV